MTIDDLFSGAENHRSPARQATWPLRMISLLAITAVLTACVYVLLRLMRIESPLWILFAAALAVAGCVRLARGLGPGPKLRSAGRHGYERETVQDGLVVAVGRWGEMLEWGRDDASRFNRRVLPRLGELADERLRQKYGFTRASDPHRARTVLGDPLWTFATMPHRRAPHPKELEQILTALEKL